MDGTLTQSLVAGVEARLPGNWRFKLIGAADPVDIVFYGPFNKILAQMTGILPGLSYGPARDPQSGENIPFASVGITSATNQDVTIILLPNEFNYERVVGDLSILNGDLDTLGTLGSITDPVDVGNWPAGFNVNNFPAGFDVDNFPSGFDVNNSPTVYTRPDPDWNRANEYQFGMVNGSVASKYPQHTVWNPAGSGKNILVHSAKFLTDYSTPQYGGLKRITALPAMSNVYVNITSIYSHNGLAAYSHPFTIRAGSDTTQQFSMTANTFIARTWLAHDSPEKEFIPDPNRPIVLTPGRGLVMCLNLSANDAQTSWMITVENA